MPLTNDQATLKDYLTIGPAGSLPLLDEDDNNTTKTIAEWVAGGNTRAVQKAVNSPEIGATLGIIVPAGVIQSIDARRAYYKGSEYPLEVTDAIDNKIHRIIGENGLFDTRETELVEIIQSLLEDPYPDCWAKFSAVLTKPGTISDHFGGISQADIDAITATVA